MPLRIHELENRPRRSIGLWDRFSTLSGWRKGAFINTVLVSIVFLVLLFWQIILWAKTGKVDAYHVIHTGLCTGDGVGRLNTMLHLVINILSSLVLASSSFFMQVLNAPSREELDSAHEKGSWLDIGVPSPRNAFKVSRFKMIMWLLFFLSSVPIHMVFNSAVFSTDNRESTFSYFVFDESLLTGGAVFDPGTSFALPYDLWTAITFYDYGGTYTWANLTSLREAREMYFDYGHPKRSASIQQTVEEIRKGNWQKLDTKSCSSLYNSTYCAGLRTYRNVALVLRGSSGWNRSQVWELPANESSFWDAHMPKDVNNSLWFANVADGTTSQCGISSTESIENGVYCENKCNLHMGLDDSNDNTWSYPLFVKNAYDLRMEFNSTPSKSEFKNQRLNVEYCLAEPISPDCQIGLASNLLLVVSACVLLKMVLCIVVIVKLGKDTSLVTPGDVIESFVSHPPDYSLGPCILDRTLLKSSRKSHRHLLAHGPLQWTSKTHRRWDAVPKQIWLSSYLIFAIGIALLIYYFSTSYYWAKWYVETYTRRILVVSAKLIGDFRGASFGQDVGNQTVELKIVPTFEQAILIANSPQLFLSFAYLAFNGLFTRLHMAKEWAAMSTRYKALRVTNPKGQQNSTYFLQLPYRYSVPLIIINVLLHWILSGCIYLLVMQGGYFGAPNSERHLDPIMPVDIFTESDDSVPESPLDSVTVIGFSTRSLFTMMTLSIVLAFLPPLFGRLSLSRNTVVVGSNSLAIAAACQVSPLVGQTDEQPRTGESPQEYMASNQEDGTESKHLNAPSSSFLTLGDRASDSLNDEERRKATLLRVSQSEIRWDVVKMPSSWAEQFNRRDTEVEHISFGLPEDDVQEPIVGHWYA